MGTAPYRRHATLKSVPIRAAWRVGDFNGGHIPDLAVTSLGNVWIRIGKGDGSFQPPVVIPLPSGQSGAAGVAVGDFNHDGRQDLTAALPFNYIVYVILGNGNGTFQTPVIYKDALVRSLSGSERETLTETASWILPSH